MFHPSLFQLQSIAVRPRSPDPRINTVRCITDDHLEDKCYVNCWALSSDFSQNALCGVWIYLLFASAVLSWCISGVLKTYMENAAKTTDVKKLLKAVKNAAEEANSMLYHALEAVKTAEESTVVLDNYLKYALKEALKNGIESAQKGTSKIVRGNLYEELTAVAAKAMDNTAKETAAAAGITATAKETTLVALDNLQAEVKVARTSAEVGRSKSGTLANAVITEIIHIVNGSVQHKASFVGCLTLAEQNNAAEAAVLQSKGVSDASETEVLRKMAKAAAEAAVGIAAKAAACEVRTEIMGTEMSQNRHTAAEAVRVKQDEMRQAAVQAAENAAENCMAAAGKKETEAVFAAAKWATVAVETLAAKEMAAKAASASQEARNRAVEAATAKAIKRMLWIFPLIDLVLCLSLLCTMDGRKDVGLVVYVTFLAVSLLVPLIRYRTQKSVLSKAIVHTAQFSFIHHLMWICLGLITEPFWAFPVSVVIGSSIFLIYFIIQSIFINSWRWSFRWYPWCFAAAWILSFVVFMSTVTLVGQNLFSGSLVSNVAQGILMLVVTLLFTYLGSHSQPSKQGPSGQSNV